VTWKELLNAPLIRVGAKTAIRTIIEDAVATTRLPLNWQYEVQHVETAVNLVEVGLGLAVVPSVDVALHRGRGLVAVPLRSPRVICTYGLVTRRGVPLSSSAAMVRDFLIDGLKSRMS
jgi:DNA-binding transcriptional LysR family regulator